LPAATTERVRALQFLAHYPKGCAEALMLAHGFTVVCLAGLAQGRLLTAELNISHVVWMQITDLGREALTRQLPKSSVPQFVRCQQPVDRRAANFERLRDITRPQPFAFGSRTREPSIEAGRPL
jgi:hypothetical protein